MSECEMELELLKKAKHMYQPIPGFSPKHKFDMFDARMEFILDGLKEYMDTETDIILPSVVLESLAMRYLREWKLTRVSNEELK